MAIQNKIKELIIHITAVDASFETIRKNHIAQGWSDIGYHYVVGKDGTVYKGRPDNVVGAHCKAKGKNWQTLGISYISRGSDIDPDGNYGKYMTEIQRITLEKLVAQLCLKHHLTVNNISGHNDYDSGKACPCFKVRKSTPFLNNISRYMRGGDPNGNVKIELPKRVLKITNPMMRGDDVKALQEALKSLGYKVGAIDGIYGNNTKSAVIAYQHNNNLEPDGMVGPNTRSKLGL